MAIKLSSNPTCVLSDADNLTAEQRQKLNLNLTKGIPGSNISGDKVTVINSDGEVELKEYSAGGGGTSYTAGNGIDITSDVISAKVDGSTIGINASGQLEALGGGGGSSAGYTEISWDPTSSSAQTIYEAVDTAYTNGQIPVLKYEVVDTTYAPVTRTGRLVLANRQNSADETSSYTQYWFIGSLFDEDNPSSGTLKQCIVAVKKNSNIWGGDSYSIAKAITSQPTVTYTGSLIDFKTSST